MRASGQRVFVRLGQDWVQLGTPSLWAVSIGEVRWIYRLRDRVIEARVWCSAENSASFLQLSVTSGDEIDFLVSHQVVAGSNEYEFPVQTEFFSEEGWALVRPKEESFVTRFLPKVGFGIAVGNPSTNSVVSGDDALYLDRSRRDGPYICIESKDTKTLSDVLFGAENHLGLRDVLNRTRLELLKGSPPAKAPETSLLLAGEDAGLGRMNEILPWFSHNASIHFSAPHGLDQYGGAAWGVRDVTQGSLEWLLASGEFKIARKVLETVFNHQYSIEGNWPQWFMFPPFQTFQQNHSHGDVCFWPLKALCDYIEASNDFQFMDLALPYTDPETFQTTQQTESLWQHCDRILDHVESRFVPGTALVNYGDGDWDDTLQPADPSLRTRMVSAWTVGLAYHTFRQFLQVCDKAGQGARSERLGKSLEGMRSDFNELLMPDGIVAGFLVNEPDGTRRPLLHPQDRVTGIRYRLLPMTRSILAELFTPEQAAAHMDIVEKELRFADGVRLMSEPAEYRGGVERLFKRTETAANLGREIGLQYVHAHIRYAEAMAKLGDAERLWWALQVINPVEIEAVVPNAARRQSNTYFSSSDADFDNRLEAAERWHELKEGTVKVKGGWRLYSSGPGLVIHKVRSCLLGVRESFDTIVFDPVLTSSLDGMTAQIKLCGKSVKVVFRVVSASFAPSSISVNGEALTDWKREGNPYRKGGMVVGRSDLESRLDQSANEIEITL